MWVSNEDITHARPLPKKKEKCRSIQIKDIFSCIIAEALGNLFLYRTMEMDVNITTNLVNC